MSKEEKPDVKIVVANKAFPAGDNELAESVIPDDSTGFSTEFELPSRDPSIRIEVINVVTEDGGKTYRPSGSFVREAGPWIGMGNAAVSKCAMSTAAHRDGSAISPEKGALKQSIVRLSKSAASAKLSYTFRRNQNPAEKAGP